MDRGVATFKYFVIVNLLFYALALEENTTARDLRESVSDENEFQSDDNIKGVGVNVKSAESDFSSPERKWISQLFYEAERDFKMNANVNEECKRDFEMYKLHLLNQSVWAIRMMESSQWPSIGIFAGMVDSLGSYDECLFASAHGIKGQYCLAQASYNYSEVLDSNDIQEFPNEESSVWKSILALQYNPVRIDRRKLTWALCIPSSCTHEDLKASLAQTLQPIFQKQNLSIIVNVNPALCKISEKQLTYSRGYYNTRLFFLFLFFLAISSTCYDAATSFNQNVKKEKKNSIWKDLLLCFSLFKNFKKLKKVTAGDVAPLHFIKIVNILFVVYGHRFIYFIGYPKFNPEAVENLYTASSIELIHTNVVDVFFMTSGFLTFYFGFLPMLKGGCLFLCFSVLFRWIRMVPVYCILVMFVIYILPYTSEGPLWNFRVMKEVINCKATWWTNLIGVSNIVKTDQQCLVISWYISTDIQLAIVGSVLLYIYTRYKKFGIFATIFTFLTCATVSFMVAYINKFHGVLRLYMSLLEEPRESPEFTDFYIATYIRAGPFLIGFLAALGTKILRDREYKFSTKQMILISLSSIIIGEGSQYYGCLFYSYGRAYNQVESALFAALNRSIFVLAYAAHMLMYFTSGFGAVGRFFEWKGFVPLGRLTYSVFLVNTVVQLFHAASQKQVMPSSSKMNLFWWVLGDVVLSYIAGLILHLFAESPISNISKIMQQSLMKLFVKEKSNESTKTDCNTICDNEKGTNGYKEDISPKIKNENSQFGYQNESFVNNEVIPKISESSKF